MPICKKCGLPNYSGKKTKISTYPAPWSGTRTSNHLHLMQMQGVRANTPLSPTEDVDRRLLTPPLSKTFFINKFREIFEGQSGY